MHIYSVTTYRRPYTHTERNIQLDLDPTDKKIHTERNTGSWWRISSRFVIPNRYSSQCEILYPLGPNSTGHFSQCTDNSNLENSHPGPIGVGVFLPGKLSPGELSPGEWTTPTRITSNIWKIPTRITSNRTNLTQATPSQTTSTRITPIGKNSTLTTPTRTTPTRTISIRFEQDSRMQ